METEGGADCQLPVVEAMDTTEADPLLTTTTTPIEGKENIQIGTIIISEDNAINSISVV